ncbi:hypothetical protein [Actinacidiphila oryziradicis]|uniref:Uncharacterized protein n=1 Tax=Actinacidiphila oryziradicis TaxID=2571141 RepID=A0A4U0RSC4_9ACTN|nr:hypothetical protein [Actinacidiphila oryziradicis]TJZ98959.1 hypothetical protein FCI23_47490 [Actinacidiphila oryziradicis]
MVTEVLSGPQEESSGKVVACPDVVLETPKRGAVAGSVVPHRHEQLQVAVLALDYQRIMASGTARGWVRAKEMARMLGLELVPAKI